jgi:hypothetical protein
MEAWRGFLAVGQFPPESAIMSGFSNGLYPFFRKQLKGFS